MIRTGSLQSDYDFYVSSDPAFSKPPVAPADDASEEQVKAFRDAATDYIHKWKVARETTDYAALLVEGQTPKKIRLGRVNRKIWRAIQDRALLPADSQRHIGFVSMMALLTRLALRSIPHLDLKLEHVTDKDYGWQMAPEEVVEILDEKDPSIVGEIGNEVLRRLQGVSPL
jgi:hypothetical protein